MTKPRQTTNGEPPTDGHWDGPAPGPVDPTTGQHKSYWVLPESERSKGFVRPVRLSYVHSICGAVTRMSRSIAETYARDPKYYGATFCVHCRDHLPVDEFLWEGTDEHVGS